MVHDDFDLDSVPKIMGEPTNGQPAPATAGPPYTNFSLKEKLRENDGKIWGNWSSSFAGACIDPFDNRYIEKGSVISMEEVGKCSGSGKPVVKFVHY